MACLACYNSGKLEGQWFDANETLTDEFEEWRQEHVERVGEDHEEYLVHDFENFDGYELGEVSVPEAQKIGAFITKDGNAAAAALRIFGNIDEAEAAVEEEYLGAFDSLEAWAEEFMEETGQLKVLPEALQRYFDFEKFARDCELSGDIASVEIDGEVHVFNS